MLIRSDLSQHLVFHRPVLQEKAFFPPVAGDMCNTIPSEAGLQDCPLQNPLLCQQKEKFSQTFDEARVSQLLSLIDERERRREGKAESKGEKAEGKCRAGIL